MLHVVRDNEERVVVALIEVPAALEVRVPRLHRLHCFDKSIEVSLETHFHCCSVVADGKSRVILDPREIVAREAAAIELSDEDVSVVLVFVAELCDGWMDVTAVAAPLRVEEEEGWDFGHNGPVLVRVFLGDLHSEPEQEIQKHVC